MMKSDVGYWIVPVFCVGLFVVVLLLMAGGMLENDRIYDKCLKTNQELSHKEAVNICKEFVK